EWAPLGLQPSPRDPQGSISCLVPLVRPGCVGLRGDSGGPALCGAAQSCLLSEKPAATHGGEKAGTSLIGVASVEHRDPADSLFFPSQTEHYRLDWHRFNLKQRLQGRQALTVEEFEEKSRAGDISSISGSDSESSDASSESESPFPAINSPSTPQCPRSHKVLLRNARGQFISAYRCILSTGKASHGPVCWEWGPREEGWHRGADICLKVPGAS
uniref:Uncharacterized protein n=1 Tax=Meleagris gallopavo TaxID=9103 RepID=A0A803YLT3_MELGA